MQSQYKNDIAGGIKMAEKIDEESISWEEATSSSGFVRLVTDVKKTLVITNWK